MLIHFMCKGNTYRSRMAEAYLRSKELKDVDVVSSGVEAIDDINGPVTWEAERIIKEHNLVPFMSKQWRQTTKELVDKSDLIIFMEQYELDYCKKHFNYNKDNYQIWYIKDIDEGVSTNTDRNVGDDIRKIKLSDETFNIIKEKVDKLVLELKSKIE